ncbi:MAG TPA: hypothetical protein VF168_06950 [Trueperaceae bacterium]
MGNGKRDKSKTLRRIAAYRHLLKSPPTDERFLIWSQSRCGTTLLTRLLDSHPRVDCEMELLARWVPWPELYVESQRRRVRAEYFGFKVFVHHLVRDQRMGRPKEFLDRMHDRGYRIIYLKRENLLRHSLSQYLRRATGVTHATSDGVVSRRYAIDVDLLLRHMRDREEFWCLAEEALSGKPYHYLSYERDLQDGRSHQRTLDGVFSFLGVESAPVHTDLRRINDRRLVDLIENYDELAAALRATPYEMWLDETPSEIGGQKV